MMAESDIEKQGNKGDEATWWCKLLARGIGVIAAISKFSNESTKTIIYLLKPNL